MPNNNDVKPNDPEPKVRLRHITKRYGQVVAARDVSIDIAAGSFVSLLGPSGCGKTTILRTIAGFEKPDSGSIEVDGRDITQLPPYKRNIGLVFQNYALWPHMTVFQNIAYGLKLKKTASAEIVRKVTQVLDQTNLTGLGERYPRELSGGQQQRVALARALAMDPPVLLLDEPLCNLDRKMRVAMRVELRQLQKELGITTLYVTHDQEEALSMSDKLVIMNQGHVEATGDPRQLYEKPQTEFVADFIGLVNILQGMITNVADGQATLCTSQDLKIQMPYGNVIKPGDQVKAAIRPERLKVRPQPVQEINEYPGTLVFIDYFGASSKLFVDMGGGLRLTIEGDPAVNEFRLNDKVWVQMAPEHFNLIQPSGSTE